MNEITVFDTKLQNNIASLLYVGRDYKDIAKSCHCTLKTVYDVKNSHKYATVCCDFAYQELFTRGAKAAVSCLIDVVEDDKAPKATRVSAADKLLHYTGLRVTEQGTLEQSPSNMSQKQIKERLAALQHESASRASVVNTVTIEGSIDTGDAGDAIDLNDLL